MKIVIFDLDGTLADLTHRLHFILGEKKDWDGFFAACTDDKPIPHMIELCNTLYKAGYGIAICSGRSAAVRTETSLWLNENDVLYDQVFMRKDGDHREDNLVKAEMLPAVQKLGEILMAFDDRDQVVKMWREHGIPCCQVAEGNF
jgi:hypothetical protein